MNDVTMYAIIGAVALVIGILAGRLLFGQSKNQKKFAEKEAEEILLLAKKMPNYFYKKAKMTATPIKKKNLLN